jgi:adhesin/invasin
MRRTSKRARHVRQYAALLIALACSDSSTAPKPANDASGARTTITATPTSLTLGASADLMVQAKTASGANITAGGAVVTLSTDAGTLSAVTDAGNGTYIARLTSTAARDAHVTGTIDGTAIAQSATVSFTPGPPPAKLVNVAGDGQSAAVSTSVAVAPAVRATTMQATGSWSDCDIRRGVGRRQHRRRHDDDER